MKIYTTEARALKRVHMLTTVYGIYPGLIKCGNGCYRLSYDPYDDVTS